MEQRDRYWIEQAALALGVFSANQLIGYNHNRKRPVRPVLEKMIAEGGFVPVEVVLADGGAQPFLVHQANLETLQKAAQGVVRAQRTTFLSPFDNLWWAPGRDEQLWGFRQRLEAYTPAAKRVWGYFCLPILHKDRLVGRFDPKLERKTGVLCLKALYLEEGVRPDEELVNNVATAMQDFMKFHQAAELVIEKSQPEDFRVKLVKALGKKL
jgi:uncharacterized protein YcaQ